MSYGDPPPLYSYNTTGTANWNYTLMPQNTVWTYPTLIQAQQQAAQVAPPTPVNPIPQKEKKMARRLVRVYVVDPDHKMPLDQSTLHAGEATLTDLSDRELLFELPMKQLLADHNAKRTRVVDKSFKDRTERLEPVTVDQLKTTVVTLATF